MKRLAASPVWQTHDEIRFLEGLGTHAPRIRATSPLTVEELLENYIEATKLRKIWNGIRKSFVLDRAKQLLRAAQ